MLSIINSKNCYSMAVPSFSFAIITIVESMSISIFSKVNFHYIKSILDHRRPNFAVIFTIIILLQATFIFHFYLSFKSLLTFLKFMVIMIFKIFGSFFIYN